jgi:hypothetical protein
MHAGSQSRQPFDLDELASGAIKGWLIVTALFAIWTTLAPGDHPLRFWAFVLFEVRLTLWLAIAALVLGIPGVKVLNRYWPNSAPWVWGAAGAIIFSISYLIVDRLFGPEHSFANASLQSGFSGVFGAVSFYFAKRQSDMGNTRADISLAGKHGE